MTKWQVKVEQCIMLQNADGKTVRTLYGLTVKGETKTKARQAMRKLVDEMELEKIAE